MKLVGQPILKQVLNIDNRVVLKDYYYHRVAIYITKVLKHDHIL